MAVVDRSDCFQVASAEHLSRRILQQIRAIRDNQKAPKYESLSSHMQHADETLGIVAIPITDQFIKDTQKVQAQFWKQSRFHRKGQES